MVIIKMNRENNDVNFFSLYNEIGPSDICKKLHLFKKFNFYWTTDKMSTNNFERESNFR